MSAGVEEEEGDVDSGEESLGEAVDEPKFKYKRILNDTTKIFQGDAATCLAVHDKFLALGTDWGRIYILDHLGNMLPNKVVVAHKASVNAISIDRSGDYIASCSNDGTVFIYGLSGVEYNQVLDMGRSIRSVALEPSFSRSGSGQQFVTGDRALVLHQRGFFTRDKQNIVYTGADKDGFISTIVWQGPYVAFANDTGVRIYDRDLRKLITQVKPRHDTNVYRSVLHPPSITFLSERELAVAWAGTIQICIIRDNVGVAAAIPDPTLLPKRVEVCYIWDLPEHFVAGISYRLGDTGLGKGRLEWRELVLLCLSRRDAKETERKSSASSSPGEASSAAAVKGDGDGMGEDEYAEDPLTASSPRVRLIEPVKFDEFEVVTEDIVQTRDSDALMPHHYRLVGLPSESLFYLLSSRDLIEIKPCSHDDHLDWLIENEEYRKALDYAKEQEPSLLTRYTVASVGRLYLDWLLEEEEFQEAAQLCQKVAGKRKDLWEEYVNRFEECGHLPSLAPFLPLRDPQLEPECYEMVLQAFLHADPDGFRRLVNDWSPDLYRIGGIITATLEKLYGRDTEDGLKNALLPPLATLYTYDRKYDRALTIYLSLRHRSVFQLIDRFRLFPQVKDKIRELMDIDTNLAVRLLLENEDSLPAALVMRQLSKQPKLQLAYLNRLFGRNEGAEFADLAVQLYANYEPARLLSFLRNSEHYMMDKALEICKAKGLVKEKVFLLGRSGNRGEALRVIIAELRDIDQAMEFCKEHDDQDLWDDLITYGVRRPEFIRKLLHNVGTHIDPTRLIQRIPSEMEIPGLPASLVKLLEDYHLRMALQEGCRQVTMLDAFHLLQRLMKEARRGVLIGDATPCGQCQRPLIQQPKAAKATTAKNLVEFGCGHGFHEACLLLADSLSACPVCPSHSNQQKSLP